MVTANEAALEFSILLGVWEFPLARKDGGARGNYCSSALRARFKKFIKIISSFFASLECPILDTGHLSSKISKHYFYL